MNPFYCFLILIVGLTSFMCYHFLLNGKLARKKIISLSFVFFSIISVPLSSSASHVAGAEITYRWISGNTFEISLTLYRDCQGVNAGGFDFISIRSASCAANLTLRVDTIPGTGHEIPLACPGATTCSGGTNPGIQKYEYKGTITLPSQCTDWVFSYRLCCRNCQITTLQYASCAAIPYLYVESRLNNVAAPSNSSPTFSNLPVSFICVGQPFNYNHGAVDPNGDSLVYSFITPRDNAGTNVTFAAGHSVTQPLLSTPPMTMNSQFGDIFINPTLQEVGVMAVLVKEYRNGVLIGSVVRDMQAWVRPCTNIYPTASGVNGTTNFNIGVCAGSTLNFTINSGDVDPGDVTTMFWNFNIPGATLTFSGSPYQVGTFSWTPTLADVSTQPYTFIVTVHDNHCPINGSQAYSYSILVENVSATAASTNVLCDGVASGTATATLSGGLGPYTFSWSPGGATTQSVTGLSEGNYTCHVTDASGCSDNATATVIAPPPIVMSIPSSSDVSCYGGNDGSATATVSGGTSPYLYSWSPSGGTAAVASGLVAGNYTVTVTDAHNCTHTASVSILQPPVFAANIPVHTNVSCFGGSNGSATATITGGTGPFTYQWTPGGATTASISGLDAGNYSVTIVDANGCTASATIPVVQPADLNSSTISTDAICNATNGSASCSVTGGVGPYTYAWSPGAATTSSISGLTAGAYTVMVTDAHGCTVSAAAGVNNFGAPSVSLTSLSPVTCFGGNNGSASVFATGGVAPLSYSWSPSGGTTTSASSLAAGNYTVTIVDNNNCSTTIPIVIAEPDQLQVNTSFTSPVCFGNTNGSAAVSVTGGAGSYTFFWSPGGFTTSSVPNLAAGNYTVTITDVNNCSQNFPLAISQPAALTATIISQTNISCFGNSNGSAVVDAGGGTSPYDYAWSPSGGAASAAAGLAAGNYTVTITDANNCVQTAPVTITQPPVFTAVPAVANVLCNGGTGSATITLGGGTLPYTYAWSSGSSSSIASGLGAGSYTVAVNDANNCSLSATVIITEPAVLISSIPVSAVVFCFGGNNGTAVSAVTGGTGPYTYQWSPTGGTSASASGLVSGNYTVTITDAHNCVDVSTVFIPQPPLLSATIPVSTNILCFGGIAGSAIASVSGGTAPYNYLWSPSGGTIDSALNLVAGNYSVTITDALGCTTSQTVAITQPALLAVSPSVVSATCSNANGSVSTIVNGGTLPYNYLWSPGGQTTTSISALAAGPYSVTVTDANGCSSVVSTPVSNLGAPTASLTSSANVTCFGGNDGSASISVSGGTAPLTYTWSPTGGTSTAASGLTAGNYFVTVLDGNNCSTTVPVTITEPTQILANPSFNGTVCFGDNNGSASVSVSGGSNPYTYQWSPTGGTSSSASGLASGNYSVTIMDNHGCTDVSTVFIPQPTALIASIPVSTNVLCFGGNNGAATASASGGTGSYTYLWSPSGVNTDTISGLTAGNYSVSITDESGCVTSIAVTIIEPPVLGVSTTIISSTCNYANGGASAIVNGGTPPYNYQWSPGGATTASISNISAGTYSVTVTDGNGCSSVVNASVTNIGAPTVNVSGLANVSCFGGNNGSASVSVSGGTPPLSYSWSPAGGTTTTATGLTAGNYTLTIIDGNNCPTAVPVVINESSQLQANTAFISPVCFGDNNGSASVSVSGGTASYTYVWSPGGFVTASVINIAAGTYDITVTDANNCSLTSTISISQPTDLTANISSHTDVSCFGNSNGSAAVNAGGGTSPYNYSWSPSGGTAAAAAGLAAGNYTVTITDAHNCIETAPVTIAQPPVLNAVPGATDVSCFGGTNGTASIGVTGGTTPYTYSWTSGGSTAVASGLAAGSYTVSVSDANNCTQSATILISQPPVLLSSIPASTSVSCFGGNNGTAASSVTGGTGPYTYAWTPTGGTSINATGLVSGNYSVTITDAHNCTTASTVFIPQPAVLNASIPASTNVLCFGGNDGSATANASGGTAPYNYVWSPLGGTTNSASGLVAGNYSVAITDAAGCTSTAPVAITQPTLLNVVTNTVSALCNFSNGSASTVVNGGTPPYTYLWAPGGATTTSISAIPAGAYSVTVTDGTGCSSLVNVPVTNVGAPTAIVNSLVNVSCFGGTDGAATVSLSGGTPPFTYAWSPTGGTLLSASGLSSGNYTLLVTDGNNCITSVPAIINQPSLLIAGVPVATTVSCYGGNNGSAQAAVSGGTSPYQYAWSPSGGIASSATGLTAGNYNVSVTDAHGCSISANTNIVQPDSMVLNATSTPATCFATSTGNASIVVGSGGTSPYSYNWSPVGGTTTSATNLAAGNYTITVNDGNGCVQSQSVLVNQPTQVVINTSSTNVLCFGDSNGSAVVTGSGGTPPYSYAWTSLGTGDSTLTNLSTGIYSVAITDHNGCHDSSHVTIGEPTPLSLVVNGTTMICFGQNTVITATVTGGVGNYSYAWSNGITSASQTVSPPVATTYSVLVADSNGCSVPAQSVNITVNPPLLSQAIGANPICEGDTTTISSSASGGNGGPYHYTWNTGSSGQSTQVWPAVTTTYTVTVSDDCETPSTATTTVFVNPAPVINFTPNPVTGCEPVNAHFFDGTVTSPGSHYFWDLGDGSFSDLQNPSHLYPHAGSYAVSLSVKSHEGCKNSLVVPDAVIVYPLPVALFNTDPEVTSIFNPVITFTDHSTGGDLWEWDLGDNSGTYSLQTITHNYTDTGTYNIRLITTTDKGCKDTTFGRITIEAEFAIYIPNAFTPDGDGTNDNFIPLGIGIRHFDMYIFNRWGTNIFHSTSMSQPWDGTVQGSSEPCQNDVYVYKIYVGDVKEKRHEYTGHVTLVR